MLEKNRVFDDIILKDFGKLKNRARHTVSAFLLGIRIAESFGIEIKSRDNNVDFKYHFFLACFYHDVGYIYETDTSSTLIEKVAENGVAAIKNEGKIKYLNKKTFRTYRKDSVDFYFQCRAKYGVPKDNVTEDIVGVIDHGIIGGLMLYDRLKKQLKNKRKSLENEYAKAADAIIAHNIWPDTLKQFAKIEKKQDLENYVLEKIGINNEICFILALADSLEPLKRKKRQSGDVLSDIYIGSNNNSNGFVMKMKNETYKECYANIVASLREWLNIEVCICQESPDSICITFRSLTKRSNQNKITF